MPRDNQKPSCATRKRGTYANMKMRLFFNPKDTPWRMKRHKLRNIGRGLKFISIWFAAPGAQNFTKQVFDAVLDSGQRGAGIGRGRERPRQ